MCTQIYNHVLVTLWRARWAFIFGIVPFKCICYWFKQLKEIVLHHPMVKPLQIVAWCCDWCSCLCWVVPQRAGALSRGAKEAEAAGHEENQHLHWYFHTLLCTLCDHKVSVSLHPGKGALLTPGEVGCPEPQQDSSLLWKFDAPFPLPWQRLPLLS